MEITKHLKRNCYLLRLIVFLIRGLCSILREQIFFSGPLYLVEVHTECGAGRGCYGMLKLLLCIGAVHSSSSSVSCRLTAATADAAAAAVATTAGNAASSTGLFSTALHSLHCFFFWDHRQVRQRVRMRCVFTLCCCCYVVVDIVDRAVCEKKKKKARTDTVHAYTCRQTQKHCVKVPYSNDPMLGKMWKNKGDTTATFFNVARPNVFTSLLSQNRSLGWHYDFSNCSRYDTLIR